MQTVTNNPLLVQEHFSENSKGCISGTTTNRYFTVFNLGKKDAEVNISLTATNEKSEPIQNWCSINPNPLVLDPGDSQEVILTFNVPQQASPDIYKYEVLFEAPEQYPNSFFRCVQQLIVSCVEQEPEWGGTPQFNINPASTSNMPCCIAPEGKFNIVIKIENRSHLVDSFELSCPDLEPQWYTVQYPERNLELPGLITNDEGLKLNPNKEGEVNLIIHPPSLTLAGDYVRTIQLRSKNRSSLILLEALYLRINSDDRLSGTLSPKLRTLPEEPGKFEIELTNSGNLIRELDLQIEDGSGMFGYNFEAEQVRLPPGGTNRLSLTAKPRWFMGWRRPLWGEGLRAKFNVIADNTYDTVLPETQKPPAIPRTLSSGTLVLSPRPRWQLIALILLATSAVGGLLFSLYWWLFRLPPAPRIGNFEAVKTVRKDETEAVVLDWRIKNPQQLDKIGIIAEGDDQKDETYNHFGNCSQDNINDCIPRKLTKFCEVDGKDINCNRVLANTAEPGKYTFELQLFPKKVKKLLRNRDSSDVIDRETSDSLIVKAAPIPQFSQNLGLLTSKSTYKIPTPEPVKLEWEVARYSKIRKLNILGNSSRGQIDVYSYVFSEKTGDLVQPNPKQRQDSLQCSRTGRDAKTCNWTVPTNNLKVGSYSFSVEVFDSKDSKQPADLIEAENTVAIEAKPLPEIKQFTVDQDTINENEPIVFSWEIENPEQIENVALKAISGDSSTLLDRYNYPTQIQEFCPAKVKNNRLRCSSVSNTSLPIGNYNFQLVIEPQLKQSEKIVEQTDTIRIKPKPQPFTIESLSINGETIPNGETYLYPIQKNIPTKVDLGWSVTGSPNVKIELLPLGEQTEMNGSIPYYLEGDREQITLRVTNELGEQQTRILRMQPYESNNPAKPSEKKSKSAPIPSVVPPIDPQTDVLDVTEESLPSINSEIIPPSTQFEPDRIEDTSPIKLAPLEIAPKAN